MPDKKTVILIDANSLIHRAFYALPSLTSPEGKPIGAVYGFAALLLKILKEFKPGYLISAFDLPEPTFRHKEYKEYKATRPKTPKELGPQFDVVKSLLKIFNIVSLEKAGFEADDILATLANKLSDNYRVIILTGDLDTLQLVNKNTVVYTPKKGISETVVYDLDQIRDRFNLSPNQLADFKALRGDPSDNIPGVPGIGEKTAITLLVRFGSLEKLYEVLEKESYSLKLGITPKILNLLKEFKSQSFFSKYLATPDFNVPLDFDVNKAQISGFDKAAIEQFLNNLGFRSLVPRLAGLAFIQQQGVMGAGVFNTEKPEKFFELSNPTLPIYFLYDISEDFSALKLFVLTDNRTFEFREPNQIKRFFEFDCVKITHNAKSVFKFLIQNNINLRNVIWDTEIAEWLINPDFKKYPFFNVFQKYGFSLNREGQYPDAKFFSLINLKFLRETYTAQNQILKNYDLNRVFFEIELPLIRVLARMELNGINIDAEVLSSAGISVGKKLNILKRKIGDLAGQNFNINSPKQLSDILFGKLKIPPKGLRKTPTGFYSTKYESLIKIKDRHLIIKYLLQYRLLTKLQSTYIDALPKFINPKTKRIHPNFIQTGTSTGRLACESPNLQQIPSKGELGLKIRSAFFASTGFQIAAFDYSQIELRILAALSKDEKLINAFKSNEDIHEFTAREIFGIKDDKISKELRNQAKILNFGLIYGMGLPAFIKVAKLSPEQAKDFINRYFAKFPQAKAFLDTLKERALNNGYTETLTGRKRFVNPDNPAMQRIAVNAPIQGSAADIIKKAMIKIDEEIEKSNWGNDVKMILQIHDELLFEISDNKIQEAAPIIKNILENVYQFDVPIRVGVSKGRHWGNLTSF